MPEKNYTRCKYCLETIECTSQIKSMEASGIYQVNKKCPLCKNRFEIVYGMNGIMTLEDAIKCSSIPATPTEGERHTPGDDGGDNNNKL